jgi:hypothetical protein
VALSEESVHEQLPSWDVLDLIKKEVLKSRLNLVEHLVNITKMIFGEVDQALIVKIDVGIRA